MQVISGIVEMKRAAGDITIAQESKRHCVERNEPYFLFVDSILVKVGNFPEKPVEEVDEHAILAALKKGYENMPKSSKKEGAFPKCKTVHVSKDFWQQILARNQQTFIGLIEDNPNFNVACHLQFFYVIDLYKICILAGWEQSYRYLKSIEYPEAKINVQKNLELRAIGGHVNMFNIMLEPFVVKEDLMLALKRTAQRFRHPKLLYFLSRTLLKLHAFSEPSKKPEVLIPSLHTICTHVIAAETIQNPPTLSHKLLSLPAQMLDRVFLQIATDGERGFTTLSELGRISPDLGRAIPISAWVNSSKSAENRTREFTKDTFLIDTDFELPLIDVFAEASSFVLAPPDEFENSATVLFPQPDREIGTASIATKEQFFSQFRAFTNGLFDGFDFSNVVVIGGSVIGSLLPIPGNYTPEEYYTTHSPFKGSDIDLCIYGLNDEIAFTKKLVYIYERLTKQVKAEVHIYRSEFTIQFCALFPYRHVQITLHSFRNIWHILTGVDIDCSAFAFDGKTLWASPRARMAVNHRWTIADEDLHPIRGSPNYELRLVKYAKRGFRIIDRQLHLYAEPEIEPEVDDYDFSMENTYLGIGPSICGAKLVLSMARWPNFEKTVSEYSSKCEFPHGEDVGLEEIDRYLEEVAEATNTGYGPGEECPIKIDEHDLGETVPQKKETSGWHVQQWYFRLTRKTETENNK
eukprot:Phypoly_transcript_04325.p1 GENE.Phypoly_transcript_04325~~Phypoly_transcript_04325.p1  ORF type:complete len:691 (-),score=92.49 Phypoly_transcript_04325:63-2135(-)